MREVGWEWRPEDDEAARDVHSGPAGAVVELDDGLVGLRGDTGEELWRFRLPEDQFVSVSLSPSGERALVRGTDERALILDTATGETLAEGTTGDGSVLLEGDLALQPTEDGPWLLARDLASGETVWNREEPVSCDGDDPHREIDRLHHSEAVVFLLHCGEDTSDEAPRVPEPGTVNALVALDPADGRELWRHEATDEEGEGLAEAQVMGDTLVANLPGEEGWSVFDPADGTRIAESSREVIDVRGDTLLVGPATQERGSLHELRGFDGEVVASAELGEDRWHGDTPATAVALPDHLVTVDLERATPEDSVDAAVTPWDGEGDESTIAGSEIETADYFEPGRLLPVPGAVLMHAVVDPEVDSEVGSDRIEHVVALQ